MKHLLLTTIAAVLLATTAFAGPIHDAAIDGVIARVRSQLDAGVDVNEKNYAGNTPLHLSASFGRTEIVELLIANDADVNAKNKFGNTPLHFTTTKEIAELLIANGADVNAKSKFGVTPLHGAASWGHEEVVELLIAKGADVNAIITSGESKGVTPLDLASGKIAALLRKHGGKTGEELKAEGK